MVSLGWIPFTIHWWCIVYIFTCSYNTYGEWGDRSPNESSIDIFIFASWLQVSRRSINPSYGNFKYPTGWNILRMPYYIAWEQNNQISWNAPARSSQVMSCHVHTRPSLSMHFRNSTRILVRSFDVSKSPSIKDYLGLSFLTERLM